MIRDAKPVDSILKGVKTEAHTTQTPYTVEGLPGLWRRIKRTGSGLKVNRPDSHCCHIGETLVELVPWYALNALLQDNGFELPPQCLTEPVTEAEASEQTQNEPADPPPSEPPAETPESPSSETAAESASQAADPVQDAVDAASGAESGETTAAPPENAQEAEAATSGEYDQSEDDSIF